MKQKLILALLALSFCIFPVNALSVDCASIALPEQAAYLERGTTWVAFRAASEAYGLAVYWDGEAAHAGEVTAQPGLGYLQVGDRYIPSAPIRLKNGTIWVPIRVMAAALGADVSWNAEREHVTVGAARNSDGQSFYDEQDLYWLSRIIHAEAQGESLQGKIAVGSVVMARVQSEDFPDTIYDVIFDTAGGVQFTPTKNGAIYNTPNEESVTAAKLVLEGEREAEGCLYFLDPRKSTSFWVPQNRTFAVSIGCHDFYY